MTFRFYIFFFQAEDGIRDRNVTGVQTCALPICCERPQPAPPRHERSDDGPRGGVVVHGRSEERRVGKECRSRWSRDHEKKKANLCSSRGYELLWKKKGIGRVEIGKTT